MARIHILQAVAGPDFSWDADSMVDLPGEEAAKWADGIRAELVRGTPTETPEVETPERTTSKRTPRPKATEKA